MTREEAISKARKLLALSQSPNENEAALALQRAREILKRFRIENLEALREEHNMYENLVPIQELNEWVNTLAHAVSRLCDVGLLYSASRKGIVFIGEQVQCKIAAYMFEFAYNQILRMVEDAVKAFTFLPGKVIQTRKIARLKISYTYGLVYRICEKILASISKSENGEKALIVVHSNDIREYIDSKYPFTSEIEVDQQDKENLDPFAGMLGYMDGNRVNIRPGLTNTFIRKNKLGANVKGLGD